MYPHHLIWLVSYPYIAPSLTLIHLITLHWNYQKKKKKSCFHRIWNPYGKCIHTQSQKTKNKSGLGPLKLYFLWQLPPSDLNFLSPGGQPIQHENRTNNWFFLLQHHPQILCSPSPSTALKQQLLKSTNCLHRTCSGWKLSHTTGATLLPALGGHGHFEYQRAGAKNKRKTCQ